MLSEFDLSLFRSKYLAEHVNIPGYIALWDRFLTNRNSKTMWWNRSTFVEFYLLSYEFKEKEER